MYPIYKNVAKYAEGRGMCRVEREGVTTAVARPHLSGSHLRLNMDVISIKIRYY